MYLFFNPFYSFSFLYVRLISFLNSLSFLILVFRLLLSLWIALNSHSLSLCRWLGLHASKKQRPWVSGSVGLEFWVLCVFFFFLLWPMLERRGGYGWIGYDWSGPWIVALSSSVWVVGFGSLKSSMALLSSVALVGFWIGVDCGRSWWVVVALKL